MEYGFVGKLYKLMRAGDTPSFQRMLQTHPPSALNQPADGCVAPVLISAVFTKRVDYLKALLDAGADPNLRGETALSISQKKKAENLAQLIN